MAHIHTITAGNLGWISCAVTLLVGILPGEALLFWVRGFGGRGFGRRGFGRGLGSFRLIRILFVLLFTTVLGPIVLVALIAFVAYRFYLGNRGR